MEKFRQDELQRIRSLADSVGLLVDTAEADDIEALRHLIHEVASGLCETYYQHITFRHEISKAGVRFPVPKPVSDPRLSVDHAAKYLLLSMAVRLARSGRWLSVQQTIIRASEWIAPEWQVAVFDNPAGAPHIELYARVDNEYVLAFRGSIVSFQSDYPVSAMIDHLRPDERPLVQERWREIHEALGEPLLDGKRSLSPVLREEEELSPEELVTALSTVSEELKEINASYAVFLGHNITWRTGGLFSEKNIGTQIEGTLARAWVELTSSLTEEQMGTLNYGEVVFVAKYLLYARMVQLIRSGEVDIGYYQFDHWATSWMWPEYDLFPVQCGADPGAVYVYEQSSVGELKYSPAFRALIPSFESNVPMAQRMSSFNADQLSLILDMTSEMARSLDQYSGQLLTDDPRSRLSDVVSRQDLVLALPPADVSPRGIEMVDMCLATDWQAVQFCKALLCVMLSLKFIGNAVRSNGVPEDGILEPCAHWNAQWLGPHWEMVIGERITGYAVPDVSITLYSIRESDRSREKAYFSGRFSTLCDETSQILKDAKILDPNGFLLDLSRLTADRYGSMSSVIEDEEADYSDSELMSIQVDDKDLEWKVRFNDRVLLAKIHSVGAGPHM